MPDEVRDDVFYNRIVTCPAKFSKKSKQRQTRENHLALKTGVKEALSPLQMSKMFALDFNKLATEEKSLFFEDRRFLTTVQEGIHQRDDGHYEMPLPLKNNDAESSNNKELGLSWPMKLKQRLSSDTQCRKDYVDFMQENIKNEFVEKIRKKEALTKNKRVWYIPHHGVYHKKKPVKIRALLQRFVSRLLPQSAASTRSRLHQQSQWGVVSISNETNSLHV